MNRSEESRSEFHIIASSCERIFTVKQTGLHGSRDFYSLLEAVQHLRKYTPENGGSVIVYDGQGRRGNRIPLRVKTLAESSLKSRDEV